MALMRGRFRPDGPVTFCSRPSWGGHGEGCTCAAPPLPALTEALRQEITLPLATIDPGCYWPIGDSDEPHGP